MSFNKIEVKYISLEELEIKYIKNTLSYNNLGIQLNRNFAICQILYPNSVKKSNSKYVLVNELKYDSIRKNIINYLIEYIIIKNKHTGLKPATTIRRIKEIKYFVEFSDSNNLNFLGNINQAQKTFLRYSKYLQSSIQNNKYAQRTGSRLQKEALLMLSKIYNINPIEIQQNSVIIHSGNELRTTKSMNEESITYCFNFYIDLFNNIYDCIINNQQYPYKSTICERTYWLLPYKSGFVTDETKPVKTGGFDVASGKVLQYEDLYKDQYIGMSKTKRASYKKAIRHFKVYLAEANSNYESDVRMYLAQYGLKAYYMLFLFTTGMNDSSAATLRWNKDYTIHKEMQNFKNIKYRANNKEVEFNIASKFLTFFKKFLILREYLLHKKFSCEYLFFNGNGDSAYISTTNKNGNLSSHINNTSMKSFNNKKLKNLTSRTIRLYKTKYLIKNHGIVEASNIVQTSLTTLLKHYTGENKDTSAEQITNYFEGLNKSTLQKTNNDQNTPAGHCASYGTPKTNISLNAINIDCVKSEGCFFCEHFRCHADEDDIRKLLSILYIIEETKNNAESIEHFNSIYLIIITRINNLLDELSKRNDNIEKIRKEVFEDEILSYYWEKRLEMFVELGVL